MRKTNPPNSGFFSRGVLRGPNSVDRVTQLIKPCPIDVDRNRGFGAEIGKAMDCVGLRRRMGGVTNVELRAAAGSRPVRVQGEVCLRHGPAMDPERAPAMGAVHRRHLARPPDQREDGVILRGMQQMPDISDR
jgi:hypothetical protein